MLKRSDSMLTNYVALPAPLSLYVGAGASRQLTSESAVQGHIQDVERL